MLKVNDRGNRTTSIHISVVSLFLLWVPSVQGSHQFSTFGGYETEAHSESSQTSKLELLGKICKLLTIFIKSSVLETWMRSEYASNPLLIEKTQCNYFLLARRYMLISSVLHLRNNIKQSWLTPVNFENCNEKIRLSLFELTLILIPYQS